MASATEAAVAPGILAAWHVLTPSEVCRRLKTDARSGLTADEAFKRLQLVGPNALTGRGPPGVFTLLVHHTLDFLVRFWGGGIGGREARKTVHRREHIEVKKRSKNEIVEKIG